MKFTEQGMDWIRSLGKGIVEQQFSPYRDTKGRQLTGWYYKPVYNKQCYEALIDLQGQVVDWSGKDNMEGQLRELPKFLDVLKNQEGFKKEYIE